MGIRINSLNLMGLRALTQQKRQNQNLTTTDVLPTALEARTTNDVHQSRSPDISTRLSDQLQSSFALNSMDVTARNYSTPGIGSRAMGVTTESPSPIVKKYPETDPRVADSTLYDETTAVTQEDMSQLRQTIAQISRDYVLRNPTTTTETSIRTEIDSQLGEGTADLFGVRVSDLGAGTSAIQFNNLDTQTLTPDENEVLKIAAENARENFESITSPRALMGHDVDQTVSKIENLFGIDALVVLDDFKSKLSQPSSFEDNANALLEASKDFLNPEQQNILKGYLDDLKNLDAQNLNSFNQNPLADDVSIEWTSNRYGPAFDSDTIESNASLTNTEGWTTNTRLGIIKRNNSRYSG